MPLLQNHQPGRRIITQAGLLQSFSETFGGTEGDPGHWNLSPEWFGSQGGSWGHDEGQIIFSEESNCGNGLVCVQPHISSFCIPR